MFWIFNTQRTQKVRKKALVILEILIGLALLSIIVTVLFNTMKETARLEVSLEKMRGASFQKQKIQARLSDLFLSIANEERASLYTQIFPKEKKESLIAIFDNGIDPDPNFSGKVTGRIFLDVSKDLSLVTWGEGEINEAAPWRKELLFSNVEDFHFEFFDTTQQPYSWVRKWPKERSNVPIMVRLYLTQGKEISKYAFFLPATVASEKIQ
jgi:hypothetical protein